MILFQNYIASGSNLALLCVRISLFILNRFAHLQIIILHILGTYLIYLSFDVLEDTSFVV